MSKYACNDIYNFKFYDGYDMQNKEEPLFVIESAKDVKFMFNIYNSTAKLIITDVLIDVSLISDILDGKYQHKTLSASGITIYRNINTMHDEYVSIDINSITLDSVNIIHIIGGTAVVMLEFEMDLLDYISENNKNININIGDINE